MVRDGTHNKAVYWPDEVDGMVKEALQTKRTPHPTNHLFRRLQEHRLPESCWPDFVKGRVVECEVHGGEVTKVITRTPSCKYPGEHNCAPILLENRDGEDVAVVKTVWINRASDNHATIRRENYICGA